MQDIQKIVEKYLDDHIYGDIDYELKNVDYASGLFRQAEDLDAHILLSMMHKRRANISLIMHLMSRSAELYLKSCLARHYSKEGFTQEQIEKELRKASSGFRSNNYQTNTQLGILSWKIPFKKNSHSLSQLWHTCWWVLGPKYNLKDNHHWGWVQNFCLQDQDGKDREDWYELVYEPNKKTAWSKTNRGLMNNETGFIKDFAKDFLEKVLPF